MTGVQRDIAKEINMDKIPCQKCGTMVLSSAIEMTDGLCMSCFIYPNKKTFWHRAEEIAVRMGLIKDGFHSNLPNVKQIEELDAQSEPVQQCGCCEYLTLSKKGIGERCGVCAWVDETNFHANLNDGLSLLDGRKNHTKEGVCQQKYAMKTRMVRFREQPPSDEIPENRWLEQVEETTEEKQLLVSNIYERIMNKIHQSTPVTEEELSVHNIYYITEEAGSGVSFEQYFRWADKASVLGVVQQIRMAEMDSVADIVQAAIITAFPDGYPSDDSDIDEAKDWSDEQLEALEKLYYEYESYDGCIINHLAEYAFKNGFA